jgi:hypothetical protein
MNYHKHFCALGKYILQTFSKERLGERKPHFHAAFSSSREREREIKKESVREIKGTE